jgi:hypothetical protein
MQEDGSALVTRKVSLSYVFDNYAPGEESTWAKEFDWLERNRPYNLLRLVRYAQQFGVPTSPFGRITLGKDGRVWDGHHRLYVASLLGIETVEVDQWVAAAS